MKKLRLGILISGRGSNLNALINACQKTCFPAAIAIVISNKSDASGLEHAKKAQLKTKVIQHEDYPDRETFDKEIYNSLILENVDLICLAGFMRLLSKWFVEKWPSKLLNIHPSLLPSFKGLDAIAQTINSGVKVSGCTVHFVVPEMDEGPIIMQAALPVLNDDSVETLSARILAAEHKCYPKAVELIARRQLSVSNKKVIDQNNYSLPNSLFNPPID